jgi:hypothetical protein
MGPSDSGTLWLTAVQVCNKIRTLAIKNANQRSSVTRQRVECGLAHVLSDSSPVVVRFAGGTLITVEPWGAAFS